MPHRDVPETVLSARASFCPILVGMVFQLQEEPQRLYSSSQSHIAAACIGASSAGFGEALAFCVKDCLFSGIPIKATKTDSREAATIQV